MAAQRFRKEWKKTLEQQQLAWRQIREDYQHIQIVSNELAEQRGSGEALNAQRVEKSAGEIYKHAVRLRANLMLPSEEAVAKDKKVQNDLQLSTLLSALNGLIKRFVQNPIFAETEVLDAQAALRAGNDLGRIIRMSEQVKKKCHNLR